MSPGLHVTLDFLLSCGVPAGLLWLDMRSMNAGKPDGDVEAPVVPSLPPLGLDPVAPRPLPDCLIPRLEPVLEVQESARELEPV